MQYHWFINLGTNKVFFYYKLGIYQFEVTEEEKDRAILLGHGIAMNQKRPASTKLNSCIVKYRINY